MLEVITKGSPTAAHPTPLLFVRGACSAAEMWDSHFRFLRWERALRRRAESSWPWRQQPRAPLESCSLLDYVEDVTVVVGELPSRPVLVGHSMGCCVVLKYLETWGAPAAA